jgi:hypothetical protein
MSLQPLRPPSQAFGFDGPVVDYTLAFLHPHQALSYKSKHGDRPERFGLPDKKQTLRNCPSNGADD